MFQVSQLIIEYMLHSQEYLLIQRKGMTRSIDQLTGKVQVLSESRKNLVNHSFKTLKKDKRKRTSKERIKKSEESTLCIPDNVKTSQWNVCQWAISGH